MRYNCRLNLMAFACFLTISPIAHADESHEGRPQVVGSDFNPRVIIAKDKDKGKSLSLCRTDAANALRDMLGMTVLVKGDWQQEVPKKKSRCFNVTGIEITKMIGGAEPIRGTLSEEKGVVSLKTTGKDTYKIDRYPDKLKSYVNQAVVVELEPNPKTAPASTDKGYTILSWAPAPDLEKKGTK